MFINSISKKYNKEGPGKKDGYDLICPVCEKVFYKKKSIVENALSDKKLRAFFCSVECKNSKKRTGYI